ncbi:MAG: hypothetical protein DSZ06_03600 [Sulfurospirillum sp.]|nr:MAG: hypothetical protein DSZ06_03600 [Sulfurospirillum sp.]
MLKKLIPIFIFIAIVALIFVSLSKKEQMVSVYKGNLEQKPLDLNLHHLQDPQCKMIIDDISHSAQVASKSGKTWVFDDVGCMILWLKDKKLDHAKMWVWAKDKNSWIDATKAWYSINEATPMRHGFGAYGMKKDGYINFNQMKNRVLRGEDLTNPIIRKKVLGI